MGLTCKRATELLFEFLENTLAPEIQRAMHTHLDGCKACGEFAATYKRTSELCRKALTKQAPADLGAKLLKCLRAEADKLKSQ